MAYRVPLAIVAGLPSRRPGSSWQSIRTAPWRWRTCRAARGLRWSQSRPRAALMSALLTMGRLRLTHRSPLIYSSAQPLPTPALHPNLPHQRLALSLSRPTPRNRPLTRQTSNDLGRRHRELPNLRTSAHQRDDRRSPSPQRSLNATGGLMPQAGRRSLALPQLLTTIHKGPRPVTNPSLPHQSGAANAIHPAM
jgi:hypothetical protein